MGVRRILVVDDEDDVREVTSMSLRLVDGWYVRTCSCGEEAIRAAAEELPDAIVLDVMMPGLDGPGTLEALRSDARTRTIPVIFLTAKAQPAEKRMLSDLSARGVIAKPFDPITLPNEIAELLCWN
ncbi:MAG TPA: response regulator [Thermoanaerobaculia bacterium]|jgi:two-component system alkaline phosphatase synthesis response regulator PhoP|nr:response regulator [Thermoanaerobaculia bacterium]